MPNKEAVPQFAPPEGEGIGDRFGEFIPEIGAHQDAADKLPTHEDLLAREKHVPLTDAEREAGRAAVEEAKRILGYK